MGWMAQRFNVRNFKMKLNVQRVPKKIATVVRCWKMVCNKRTHGVCVCLFLWAFRAFTPIINMHSAHWIRTDRKMIMFTSDGFFPSVARFRNEHSILIQQPPELFKSFRCQCTRVSFLPPSLTNILHWNVPWAAGSHGFERAFEWLGNRMCERICFN